MSLNKEDDDIFYDNQGIMMVDHLIIKDVDSHDELLNQQGSTKNIQEGGDGS